MEIEKLTSVEIEYRILHFTDRISTIGNIIKDLNDPITIGILQLQQSNYKTALTALEKELLNRK